MTNLETKIVDAIVKAVKYAGGVGRVVIDDNTMYELYLIERDNTEFIRYYDCDYFRLCKVDSPETDEDEPRLIPIMDIASRFDYGSVVPLIVDAIKHDLR